MQLSAGYYSTCALEGGKAYCWGQLGGDSSIPVAVDIGGVLAGKLLTHISVGDGTACALDSAGKAYCWNRNLVPAAVSTGPPRGSWRL
jgi:hypothetical protein